MSLGYRSLDTAAVYGNERDIGVALKELLPKYNLKREDIRITTKLPPSEPPEQVPHAINESLENLACGYIDLYLIHWPGQSRRSGNSSANQLRADVWSHLITAQKSGLLRDIGVSNYTPNHITELLKHPSGVKPAVNQIEWHPYNWDATLKSLCKQNGILIQAYSSLGGTNNKDLVNDKNVRDIAEKLNKGPAQVLLRWAVQQGVAVIPKARTRPHLEDNISLDFEISAEDLEVLNNLQGKKQRKYAWDPKTVQ